MFGEEHSLSAVIVTYNRDQVLVETIRHLLEQIKTCEDCKELLIIDQTKKHDEATDKILTQWNNVNLIRWIRLSEPNLTRAMNRGLLEAKGSIVFYTDDDIIPGADLLKNHLNAYRNNPRLFAVVGQVLQPGEEPQDLPYNPSGGHLKRYMDFPFRSMIGRYIENAMAGNLSVIRSRAIEVGGFDENYHPPVASRFESEFAKRVVREGGKIWFEPSASIRHLAAKSGGTRSKGSHLNSASPRYGVGDYYFALKHGDGLECFAYCMKRYFREVRTKFHLKHPWYIPVKLIGEMRAIIQAYQLYRNGAVLIDRDRCRKSLSEKHP